MSVAVPAGERRIEHQRHLRVIKDAAELESANVTLNKKGAHPTTYDVITGGAATSRTPASGQTVRSMTRSSRAIQVSLDGGTGTVGARGHRHSHDRQHRHHHRRRRPTVRMTATTRSTSPATCSITRSRRSSPALGGGADAGLRLRPRRLRRAETRISTSTTTPPPRARRSPRRARCGRRLENRQRGDEHQRPPRATPLTPLAPGGNKIYIAGFAPGGTEGLVTATHTIADSDENIPGAHREAEPGADHQRPRHHRKLPGQRQPLAAWRRDVQHDVVQHRGRRDGHEVWPRHHERERRRATRERRRLIARQRPGEFPVRFQLDSRRRPERRHQRFAAHVPIRAASPPARACGHGQRVAHPNGNHTLVLGDSTYKQRRGLNVNDNNLIVHNASVGTSDQRRLRRHAGSRRSVATTSTRGTRAAS